MKKHRETERMEGKRDIGAIERSICTDEQLWDTNQLGTIKNSGVGCEEVGERGKQGRWS